MTRKSNCLSLIGACSVLLLSVAFMYFQLKPEVDISHADNAASAARSNPSDPKLNRDEDLVTLLDTFSDPEAEEKITSFPPPPAFDEDWIYAIGSITFPSEALLNHIEENDRNADSYLSAYALSHDPNYLLEGIQNNPGHILLTQRILAEGILNSDDARELTDQLIEQDPDNGFNFLVGAMEAFRLNEKQRGLDLLKDASLAIEFDTNFRSSALATKEALVKNGWPTHFAMSRAIFLQSSPENQRLIEFTSEVLEHSASLQEHGDIGEANELLRHGASVGMNLAHDKGLMITEVLGLSIERTFLEKMNSCLVDGAFNYSIENLRIMNEEQAAILNTELEEFGKMADHPNLTPKLLDGFFDRLLVEGETAAFEWLKPQIK